MLKALEKQLSSRHPTATELHDDLAAFHQSVEQAAAGSLWGVIRRPRVALPALLLAALLGIFGTRSWQRSAERQWARQEALPEVVRLIEEEEYATAFELARDVERVIPDDPMLAGVWSELVPGGRLRRLPRPGLADGVPLGPSRPARQRARAAVDPASRPLEQLRE